MSHITLDYLNVVDFVSRDELKAATQEYKKARELLISKSGRGNDFLGWMDLPEKTSQELIGEIEKTAGKIRKNSDLFIVIGIGGSYLGARACIEMLLPNNYNQFIKPQVYFSGNSISPGALNDLLKLTEGKDVSLNVISKSGTTTEPALAFRVMYEWMVKKYGSSGAAERIIVTTDASKGALLKFAKTEGMKTFVIPDDVGGRFSVLTPVGLLPVAVAGVDIRKLLTGAKAGTEEYRDMDNLTENPSALYAVLRNLLYRKGKNIEILANFEPKLHYFAEWWKQLFGESEGKEGKGIFPASCDFTTDLHSMGQWIQDGRREIFETFINVELPDVDITITKDDKDLDGLNYLAGKTFSYVNRQAMLGTIEAHRQGGVPSMLITIPQANSFYVGKLFYFFEWAVAISGYMLGVNPFDQPGVEHYKKNMFRLLGKPV